MRKGSSRSTSQTTKVQSWPWPIATVFRFDGQAPFRFTNDHFNGKVWLTLNNPVVKATMELMGSFVKAENAAQGKLNGNK